MERVLLVGMSDVSPQRRYSREIVLDRARIVAYAREFDPQKQHLDEAAAAETAFGELVASGWQTVALSMRLAEEACPALVGGERRIVSVKWLRPVRPGDRLRVGVDVLAPIEAGELRVEIITLDGGGETVQSIVCCKRD